MATILHPALSPEGEKKAIQARTFIENLKHTKGRWAGVNFRLMNWQWENVIRPLYGTLRPDGFRQFKTVYVEIPKKNGKSELAAAIALKSLFADGEHGGEVYSAAADKDQASIVFNVAADMVRQHPKLLSRCRILDTKKRIVVNKTGSIYQALSADAFTKHGFNSSTVVFDELHTQKTRELWDTLTLGAGDAREQPIFFAITTAGYDRKSICWEQHEYAKKILDGIIQDPSFLPVIYAVDDDADWENKDLWIAANPSLAEGEILKLENLEEQFNKAKETPALQNTFRRLRLNQWTEQDVRFLDIKAWDACKFRVNIDGLRGRRCYGGLDLSSTTDIAAFVLVFPPLAEGDKFQVVPYFWIPEDGMRVRAKRDRVPYDLWVKAGLIQATPGNLIDYKFIYDTIDQAGQMFKVEELAFDRWGSVQIITDLANQGVNVVQFGQGFASMAAPTKELLRLVLEKGMSHGGNAVLRWMASNMVVKQDPQGNIKPDKAKSTEKIDGMVALVMALDRAIRGEKKISVYEDRGVLAI